MGLELALHCRHYRGDRPCRHGTRCRCEHYDPMGHRVLVIKLGALGDVVRTACLLPTLKRHCLQSHITWVSKPSGVQILTGHPQIDRLVPLDAETILALSQQRFDLVLSLDKEPGPTALCNAMNCPDKRGIGMSACGTPQPCNVACEPYFELGLDDRLKFHHNRKSYPQLIHEALALPYLREPYRLYPGAEALRRARHMFDGWRTMHEQIMVGLNTGSGSVFANKVPAPGRWVEIARRLRALGYGVVLLGGANEAETNAWIAEQVGQGVCDTGCDNTERQFVALIGRCDAVVTGDTLALHIAVARRVPVVALIGPTCEQEIDLFDRGRKIVTTHPCSPCYRRECDRQPSCMDAISAEDIVTAVHSLCRGRRAQRVAQ